MRLLSVLIFVVTFAFLPAFPLKAADQGKATTFTMEQAVAQAMRPIPVWKPKSLP